MMLPVLLKSAAAPPRYKDDGPQVVKVDNNNYFLPGAVSSKYPSDRSKEVGLKNNFMVRWATLSITQGGNTGCGNGCWC